jgi:hypothetical protein
LKRRHVVNFQEANVTEHGDCSGDSDINPQGDAHFVLPGDEVTGGARSLLAALRLATWPCGKSGLFGPSLNLEIIAQGEADERDEDDRNEVLSQHQLLIAFRRNERARTVAAGAEKKFFDLGVDGERADERHSIAKCQHPHGMLIFVHISRYCLRRKHGKITPIEEKPARDEPRETAAIIGKRPVEAHDRDPNEVREKPRNFDGDPDQMCDALVGIDPLRKFGSEFSMTCVDPVAERLPQLDRQPAHHFARNFCTGNALEKSMRRVLCKILADRVETAPSER